MRLRYTRIHVWIILLAVVACVIIVLEYSAGGPGVYKSANPITDTLITKAYPELYESLYQRDAGLLKPFLTHQSPDVRDQAWRGLATTPVDSLHRFIELALQQNSEAAWFAISQHACSGDQLRGLEAAWGRSPEARKGIARVLGMQGDEQSLQFLMERLGAVEPDVEHSFALALSRMVRRFSIGGEEQVKIIQRAFDVSDEDITRAYLYGWYRGAESSLSSTARDTLYSRWQILGAGISAEVDQYVNRLLKRRTTYAMTIFYNGEQRLENEFQLSVELAQSIAELPLNDKNSLAAKMLMTHDNAHVQVQALQSIAGKTEKGGDLNTYVKEVMVPDSTLDHVVWLQALQNALQSDSTLADRYRHRLQQIQQQNPYLLPAVLDVYRRSQPDKEYLNHLNGILEEKSPLLTMYVLQDLNLFWQNLEAGNKTPPKREQVREIVFRSLELRDRGVAYMAEPLLQHSGLFTDKDFNRINSVLSTFSLPEDIEVFQAFGSLYKQQFERQARPVIDSLSALNYLPLNRSLAEAGWEVNVSGESKTAFREPDWKRLWQLGRQPTLTLRTEKGNIQIRMNPLMAPATVSAIDSLSRAGAYNGIPFHRVVPNFVIQGGDIERKDGFGGPDFVIPTEASEHGFVRGAAGIASAGTDTEGSQYFIMHQWKPHLNGSYTRFGLVTQGMDVVDRMVVGDRVLSTTWY